MRKDETVKRTAHILILLCVFLVKGFASTETFEAAQQDYNAGRYAQAAKAYEGLLEAGLDNMEIHYNLANAYFKNGELSQAVWHYRTAWYEAPRDPDVRANLKFALHAAEAVPPEQTLMQRFFRTLSLHEWLLFSLAGYLVVCLLLLMALLVRRGRRFLLRLCLLPAAVMLLAGGGWWSWNRLGEHPECVVAKGAMVRHSPFKEGVAFYKVPPGALVRQEAVQGNWVRIRYDNKSGGWINKENILPLSP